MVDIPCLPKKNPVKEESVDYFKTFTLSIFCLFNLTRQDAADIISCLEYIDKSYSQTIDVVEFADAFCPNSKAAFISLWKKTSVGYQLKFYGFMYIITMKKAMTNIAISILVFI